MKALISLGFLIRRDYASMVVRLSRLRATLAWWWMLRSRRYIVLRNLAVQTPSALIHLGLVVVSTRGLFIIEPLDASIAHDLGSTDWPERPMPNAANDDNPVDRCEQQAREVRAVKKYESGIIRDPVTIGPEATLQDLYALTQEHGISGVPVVSQGRLAGIITSRDLRFERRTDAVVKDVMTPRDRLVAALEGSDFDYVTSLFHRHKIEKVLLVNDVDELTGMITVKDIVKAQAFPMACKDTEGQLRVGASVGTSDETQDRVAALVDAGVDVVVVDTAHGHSAGVLQAVSDIRKLSNTTQIIGGNIATADGAQALIDAGVDLIQGFLIARPALEQEPILNLDWL